MADLSPGDVLTRLLALRDDLEQFPPAVRCPWPLAQIFNELLKRSKRIVTDDPVLRLIRAAEEAQGDDGMPQTSVAAAGTIRALITQIAVALEDAASQSSRDV